MTSFEKLLSELPERYRAELQNAQDTINRLERLLAQQGDRIVGLEAHLIRHGLLQNGELIER